MAISAADVKRLRDETDAPMMECKAALEEAGGDFEKAKNILREKGKAAAAKRAERSTAEGVVAFAASADAKTVAAVVVECETDFVAKNEDFVALVQQIADLVRDTGQTSSEDSRIKELVEGAVAKIRENIKLSKAQIFTSDFPIATYVHHDRKSGSVILSEGENAGSEAVRKVAVHAAWSRPEFISKDELSQEKLDAEIELETQRAIKEGKDEKIARNIAQGRVNKEYIKQVVLMEQPFYADQSKSVGQYLSEEAKGAKITSFAFFGVGQ